MCEVPEIDEYHLPGRCDRYGRTETECLACGFIKKHSYSMFEHTITQWELLEAPTLRTEGLSEGTCDKCGIVLERREPVLEPEPEPTVVTMPTEAPAPVEPQSNTHMDAVQGKISILFLVLAVATVLLTVSAALVAREFRRKG